ncbi:hypothetical protein Tco_1445928 [Tanacetum coccineum]
MNMGQDRHIQNVRGNGGNQFGQYIAQNVGNQVVQNPGVQNVGNQNGLIVFPRIPHPNRNQNVRPRRRDAIQTQLLIAQKEEAKIQLQAEEYDLMSIAADIDEIEEVNANSEVHCDIGYNNDDIFNMFTQEDQYYELREPIPESHLVQQNDSDVITAAPSEDQYIYR